MPEKVTLKINQEDVQGDVKWDNLDVNAKKVGEVTYQGRIDKYGRTVQ